MTRGVHIVHMPGRGQTLCLVTALDGDDGAATRGRCRGRLLLLVDDGRLLHVRRGLLPEGRDPTRRADGAEDADGGGGSGDAHGDGRSAGPTRGQLVDIGVRHRLGDGERQLQLGHRLEPGAPSRPSDGERDDEADGEPGTQDEKRDAQHVPSFVDDPCTPPHAGNPSPNCHVCRRPNRALRPFPPR